MQIAAYLDAVCPVIEAQHRRGQRLVLPMAFLGAVCGLTALVLTAVLPRLQAYILVVCIPLQIFLTFFFLIALDTRQIRGCARLLSEHAGVKQVPSLVSALEFAVSFPNVRQKLSELLPLYSEADNVPLNKPQSDRLARELTQRFKKIVKEETITGDEFALTTAILIYFERELAQGRTVPKSIIPVLQRFATAPASDHLSSSEWTMLKSVTKECIAYVGARR